MKAMLLLLAPLLSCQPQPEVSPPPTPPPPVSPVTDAGRAKNDCPAACANIDKVDHAKQCDMFSVTTCLKGCATLLKNYPKSTVPTCWAHEHDCTTITACKGEP